jgi:hypothetical protein
MASGEIHRGSADSLLALSLPPIGRAVNMMENSWRTSPLLV